jgi:hypothetical protein
MAWASDPYKILDVKKDATNEQIKAAFQEKVKKGPYRHPDCGGDAEKFKELMVSYKLLLDPVRRKHYDETGSIIEEKPKQENKVSVYLSQMLHEVIRSLLQAVYPFPESVRLDFVILVREKILERNRVNKERREKILPILSRLKYSLGNITPKGHPIEEAVRVHIAMLGEELEPLNAGIKLQEEALEILKNCKLEGLWGEEQRTMFPWQHCITFKDIMGERD